MVWTCKNSHGTRTKVSGKGSRKQKRFPNTRGTGQMAYEERQKKTKKGGDKGRGSGVGTPPEADGAWGGGGYGGIDDGKKKSSWKQ